MPEHKFNHSFQNLLNPISNCRLDIELLLLRYLLHYPKYNSERHTLLRILKNIDNNLLDLTKPILTTTLLFGSDLFYINTPIHQFGLSTKRFDWPLFQWIYWSWNKVPHKKLNKRVSIWLVTRLSFSIYYFSSFFLCS